MIKEVYAGSFLEAKLAEQRGADRIELCDKVKEGGTTASYGIIKKCVDSLKVPIFALIRPRIGDYVYSSYEKEIMKEDVKLCKAAGVDGIVIGFLTKKNEIDYDTLQEFIDLALPMEITFSNAIDELEDPVKEIKKLKAVGVNRILSYGKEETALLGKELFNKMIQEAGKDIPIIVAGRITKDNLKEVSSKIKSSEYHGRKIV